MKKLALITLLFAVALPSFIPMSAYAMTFVTPSGAIVNELGQLISAPPAATTTVSVKHSTYESKVYQKPVYITFSSFYNYF